MKKRIAVGLSGGIDSSVAAYLLKKQGFQVVGFTLKFYPQENRCCDLDSLYQAQRLCHSLGIPHYVIDVGELFRKEVINYFIKSYLDAQTPNPCAQCNRLIKFGVFLKKIKSLGIEYLATGHYARLVKNKNGYLLRRGKDQKKSQEYFLSLIKPDILKFLVFPLGNYTKEEVKRIAQRKKIIFKARKESQDICFIKDKYYFEFIEENLAVNRSYAGEIRHIKGNILGRHKGIYYYTYGQRQGLGVSGKSPLYVTAIDSQTNTIIVGEKKFLYRNNFFVHSLNWFVPQAQFRNLKVKVRYNSPLVGCIINNNGNKVKVKLLQKIDAVAPGQVAAFYYKDIIVGAGIIARA